MRESNFDVCANHNCLLFIIEKCIQIKFDGTMINGINKSFNKAIYCNVGIYTIILKPYFHGKQQCLRS